MYCYAFFRNILVRLFYLCIVKKLVVMLSLSRLVNNIKALALILSET